jgi:RimJ/RimL family protein N-acetyltransferase
MPDQNQTRFRSQRLTMRPWQPDEAERLLDIRRRPDVARWLSDPEPWKDVEYARDMIDQWASGEDPPLGIWAIIPDGTDRPVGTVMLKHLPASDEVEVGWYLHPDSRGHGFAVEAAGAALRRATEAGITRVWAIMWPHNRASARVAERAGMVDLGVRPDPWYGTVSDPDSRMFRYEAPLAASPT